MNPLVHVLETSAPLENHFGWIKGGYTITVHYTLIDDVIDIHVATIRYGDSSIEHTIASLLHGEIRRIYSTRLRENAAQDIEAERIFLRPDTVEHNAQLPA